MLPMGSTRIQNNSEFIYVFKINTGRLGSKRSQSCQQEEAELARKKRKLEEEEQKVREKKERLTREAKESEERRKREQEMLEEEKVCTYLCFSAQSHASTA
jgi:hypothetical protein